MNVSKNIFSRPFFRLMLVFTVSFLIDEVVEKVTDNVAKDVVKDERHTKLINAIIENKKITIPEIAISLCVTKRTVQRDIQLLKNEGRIKRVGGRKTGYWEIL